MNSAQAPANLCPCHSGNYYQKCCQPFHQGKLPDTAQQLMRSRYAAYALNLPAYIIATTHPANPNYSSDTKAWTQHISDFAQHTTFRDLTIVNFQESGNWATVTFIAYLDRNQQDCSYQEVSSFEKIENKWLYHSGQISPPQ